MSTARVVAPGCALSLIGEKVKPLAYDQAREQAAGAGAEPVRPHALAKARH